MKKENRKKLRNQVFYQIFVRNYKAGTFQAVEQDLDRIRRLGADWIYLLPIHPTGEKNRKGTLGSPYAIRDYRAVDPSLGTLEDFVSLCDAAHQMGLKVMMDVVYNHTSPDSVLAKTHPEWFYHRADGSMGNRVGEWWDVVDLDYSHEELWEYQIDTLKFWANYADGFRCDVAEMLPGEFWCRAAEEVSRVNPDCVWLAESGELEFVSALRHMGIPALSDGELYQSFDICYDYDVYPWQKAVQLGRGTLKEYVREVMRQEAIYSDDAVRLRFLENHDRPRAASLIPDHTARLSWMAWSFFAKGAVLVYMGQESGERQHPGLFDLCPVFPGREGDDSAFLAKLSELKQDPLFADCDMMVKASGKTESLLIAELTGRIGSETEGRKAVGIFPLDGISQAAETDLPDGIYTDALSGREIEVFEGVLLCEGMPLILFAQSRLAA